MLTVKQSLKLMDDVEKAIYGLETNPEVLLGLANQVVELEKTFIAKGIETDETETDKAEDIVGFIRTESRNFRRWLQEKVIEYFDWSRMTA